MTGPVLSVGVIGLGVGAQHIAGWARDGRVHVAAVCDPDRDALQRTMAACPGARGETDPAAVLGDPTIAAVSIASPDDAHGAQVVAALLAGKHVFVEKPLCLTDDEFDAIAAALDRRPDLQLSSNLLLRRYPRFAEIERRVRAGAFGTLYRLEADYDYGRLEKVTGGWRGRIPHYAVMHGGGIHVIDLVMWLKDARPVEAFAYGSGLATAGYGLPFPDTVVALLRFADGAVGKIGADFACVRPHFHAVTLSGTLAAFSHTENGAFVWSSRDPGVAAERLDLPYPGVGKDALLPEFAASILDGTPPVVTTQEVLDAMAVALAIERARRTGRPQTITYHERSPVRRRHSA